MFNITQLTFLVLKSLQVYHNSNATYLPTDKTATRCKVSNFTAVTIHRKCMSKVSHINKEKNEIHQRNILPISANLCDTLSFIERRALKDQ